MAVFQLWKERKIVATAVLIELMDEEDEREAKQEREVFLNNIVCETMLEDTRFDVHR